MPFVMAEGGAAVPPGATRLIVAGRGMWNGTHSHEQRGPTTKNSVSTKEVGGGGLHSQSGGKGGRFSGMGFNINKKSIKSSCRSGKRVVRGGGGTEKCGEEWHLATKKGPKKNKKNSGGSLSSGGGQRK